MDFSEFKGTLKNNTAPADVSVYLKALWHDANGDWQEAHNLIENLPDKTAARIHAYLHRKEGDQGNALYWYRRAGMRGVSTALNAEWDQIAKDLL
jgi:hypothetical protein